MKELKQKIAHITAIEPFYAADGGNFTYVYTKEGEQRVEKFRLRTTLKKIVNFYGFEVSSLHQKYGALLGSKQNVPLPLTASLVLVPLKMRRPRFGQDGAIGYVNACCVEAVEAIEKTDLNGESKSEGCSFKCRVCLTGGVNINSLFSAKNTNKRLQAGRQALAHHLALQGEGRFKVKNPGCFAQALEEAPRAGVNNNRLLLELIINQPGQAEPIVRLVKWGK